MSHQAASTHPLTRRGFLTAGLTAAPLLGAATRLLALEDAEDAAPRSQDLHLATFRFDVTPPGGHPLCGGWIRPVEGVDDPLEAIGLVLLGAGRPIVLCAVDWTGILNEAHLAWRKALAEAAGTTPERVAVHAVHQHNAPFACLEAERIVASQGDLPHIVDVDFFRRSLDRGRDAVRSGVDRARPVTAIATGEASVEKVASNRRIVGASGKVEKWRGSSTADPALRELPEGLIDPLVKTIAFYDGERKIAACHYYATHPMSYYGDGRVSSDFAGLARKRRQKDEPHVTHLYFTGCAGNIAAGKYNDGSKEVRPLLAERLYRGIVASETKLRPQPIGAARWRTAELLPPARSAFDDDALEAQISDASRRVVDRNRPAYTLAWLRRLTRGSALTLSSLALGDVSVLHLPAECFVEYQLAAQQAAPTRFVAVAAYGDGGPWYIPTAEAYPQGGYEVSVAFCDPGVDPLLRGSTETLLSPS